jgi:hypothetical protein
MNSADNTILLRVFLFMGRCLVSAVCRGSTMQFLHTIMLLKLLTGQQRLLWAPFLSFLLLSRRIAMQTFRRTSHTRHCIPNEPRHDKQFLEQRRMSITQQATSEHTNSIAVQVTEHSDKRTLSRKPSQLQLYFAERPPPHQQR